MNVSMTIDADEVSYVVWHAHTLPIEGAANYDIAKSLHDAGRSYLSIDAGGYRISLAGTSGELLDLVRRMLNELPAIDEAGHELVTS